MTDKYNNENDNIMNDNTVYNDDNSPVKGPWGQGPNKGSHNQNGKGSNSPVSFEDFVKSSSKKLEEVIKNKRNGGGNTPPLGGNLKEANLGKLLFLGFIVVSGLWFVSGIHQIGPGQRGVIMTLGKFSKIEASGLHYRLPYPLTHIDVIDADLQQKTEIGFRLPSRRGGAVANTKESLMLTGDKNIVDITFTVDWKVDTAFVPKENEWSAVVKYAYNIENSASLVKSVSEASIREVVGSMKLENIITGSRAVVQQKTAQLIQTAMDNFDSGIKIVRVNLQEAAPPQEVVDAFRDVIDAGSEAEVKINKARRYANEKIPQAQAKAEELLEEAEAYYSKTVAESRGQAEKFNLIRRAYASSPSVTKKRLYLESMERILAGSEKIIVDKDLGNSIVPYLPLRQKELK